MTKFKRSGELRTKTEDLLSGVEEEIDKVTCNYERDLRRLREEQTLLKRRLEETQ